MSMSDYVNGPVVVKKITDYSKEQQEYWQKLKPDTNAYGKEIPRAVMIPPKDLGGKKRT